MKCTITAPERYTGVIAGVSFSNGEGETENTWLINWFTEKGYTVKEIKEENPGSNGEEDHLENNNDNLELSKLNVKELKELAKENNIQGYSAMSKEQLIEALGEK